jgi:hypothetical protein
MISKIQGEGVPRFHHVANPPTPPQARQAIKANRAERDSRSEMKNQIAGYGKLIMLSAVIVGLPVPGPLET